MKIRTALLAALMAAAAAVPAHALSWNLGQWYQGTNGHYYSVNKITGGTSGWLIGRAQAQTLVAPDGSGVDLVTLTDALENRFVFDGINDPIYWSADTGGGNEGPNIGLYQYDKLLEPTGHFAWVTGEAFNFTSWSGGEPNNFGGFEDYGTYYGLGSNRTLNWNDISSTPGGSGGQGVIDYYVAESGVPEPTVLAPLTLGLVGLVSRRRR